MRARHLLLAFPLGFFACLSNNASNTNDDGGSPDLDASFDSAVPSSDSAPGVDATQPTDAPVEAAAPVVEASVDSGPPTLTVIVGGPQGLESGISVVWGDSTGAVVGTSTTGASGTASSTDATVSMATVVMGTTSNPFLYTVMGVQLGQSVVVADVSSLGQTFSPAASLASVPSTPSLGDANGIDYFVASGDCQSSDVTSFPVTYNLFSPSDDQPCVGYGFSGTSYSPALPVLAEADDSTTNVPLGYAFSKTGSLAETPDDAGYFAATVASPWQTTMPTQTVIVTNAPSTPYLAYSEQADGVLTPLPQFSTTLEDGGSAQQVYTHPGFADDVQIEARFQAGQYDSDTIVASTSLPPTTNGTTTIDATAVAAAPAFTMSNVDSTTSRPVISWTLGSGTLAASTTVIAAMTWYGQNDGGEQNGTWTIVSPGTAASSLTAPAVPAALSVYAPPAGANSEFQTLWAMTGSGGLSTYESLLPTTSLYQTQAALCGVSSPAVAPLPGIGSVVMSFYTNEGGC